MSFLRKLFGNKEPVIAGPSRPAPAAPIAEPPLNPEAIIPLAALSEPREILERIRTGENDTAFHLLNELKASKANLQNTDYLRAHLFLQKNQPVAALEALKEELRYFPNNAAASRALASVQRRTQPSSSITDPEFKSLLAIIRPYTMVGEERLYSLFNLAREACVLDRPGNFVECGVAAGGSSALLASVIKKYSSRPRLIYSFDTFEGMPPATKEDAHLGTPAEATGWGQGTCAAPIDSLLEAARKLEAKEFVRPMKGLFAQTLPVAKTEIGPVAFLHVDGDWYSSTMDVMNHLYEQVLPGAAIQVDDYGFWEGCKKAIDDFQRERGLEFDLKKIDFTGVWFYKPSTQQNS
jgi:O-methyltransferase